MHFGPLRGPLGPLNDAYVADEEVYDPYAFPDETLELADDTVRSAASYALCCAQTIDTATEAYGSLTMASSCDPVPCLGYISSGLASLAWILQNAKPEELKAMEDGVNQAMSEIIGLAAHLKVAHEIEKEWKR